jgi:asparaginyl-tRNA synthetase
MKHVYINELKNYIEKEVQIKGWLYNKRSKGKIHFLLIRDGTGIVQCTVSEGSVPDAIFKKCEKITQESAIIVEGTVKEDNRAPGGIEIYPSNIELVSESKDYPIQIQDVVPEVGFLLDKRHLWIRSRKQHATLKIRAGLIQSIRKFFDSRGFTCIDAPILTPTICEGTTTLFEVKYFDEKAYLSQSGQLYMEAAAMAFGKVYCFGPTFRAEKSKTRRHLTEFWMVEPEVAYLDLDGLMELAEEFIVTIVQEIIEKYHEELKILGRNIENLKKVTSPFPKISYDEAIEILKKKNVEFTYGEDFGAVHEETISKSFDKPVIIHRYPAKCKAFYMEPDPINPQYALCMDMLAPEGYGEIIGGSQRIHDISLLEKRIKENNLPRDAFKWYIDLRKYGSVPHSGFGLGLERTVAWICGAEHVRECIPFPRMLYRIYP